MVCPQVSRGGTVLSCAAILGTLAWPGAGTAWGQAEPLPFDETNPVIYDNDGAWESGWLDVYILSLASAGAIDLRGIVTSSSFGEEARTPPYSALENGEVTQERQLLIEKARRSGIGRVPDALAGPSLSFQSRKPATGRIEDTVPFNSPAAQFIVQEARKATAAKPLVILMGGQATAVADAFLLDPSIADRVVLSWIILKNLKEQEKLTAATYNGMVDGWGTYIALEKFRSVILPESVPYGATEVTWKNWGPWVPKEKLFDLPDTELRQTMIEAWPVLNERYSGRDADSMVAFPVTRDDYIQETRRYTFSGWQNVSFDWAGPVVQTQVPVYAPASAGKLLVVFQASQNVATDEFWSRLKAPAAWGPSVGQVPFGAPMGGPPWPVPGTIEAEHFDFGGTGRGHKDNTININKDASWINPLRLMENADVYDSGTASGKYKIGSTEAGEWLAYTVDVAAAGTYTLEVRVASKGSGGTFHVEFDGTNRTGGLAVPDTGGWDTWTTLKKTGIPLAAGRQVLRLVMEANGGTGAVGDFDSVRLVAETPPGAPGSGSDSDDGRCGATGIEMLLLLGLARFLRRTV